MDYTYWYTFGYLLKLSPKGIAWEEYLINYIKGLV